ncbi:phage virion morphogenesis protein [Pararhodobacter sp.]|uniref:phage virion morphogenesis protein n=1 Tax=Pararhodobacter sp. TaxID=2127056 RepID=UPI002AFE6469|nr:phage virion morphogenesis protein [Pararhodobacter sp.]
MITLDIKDADVTAALDRLARAITDMTPTMGEIEQYWLKSTKQRMREGKSPDGSSFAPRSEATLANYARKGLTPGAHPLWLSGDMRENQIHSASGSDYVEIGSSAIQAAVMQFGAEAGAFGARMGKTKPSEKRKSSQAYFFSIPWGNIPARPFLGMAEADKTAIEEIVGEWLTRVAGSP